MAIGAVLAIAIFLGGRISGGAFNPAVAIAMMHSGKIASKEVIPYIIVEILGGLAGLKLAQMV